MLCAVSDLGIADLTKLGQQTGLRLDIFRGCIKCSQLRRNHMTGDMEGEQTDSAKPAVQDAATPPAAGSSPQIAPRPEPPVSIQEARLALARTSAASQAAARPPSQSDAIERRATLAMNVSW